MFILSEKVASHNCYIKSIQECTQAENFQLVKPYQLSGTTLPPTIISTILQYIDCIIVSS